VNRLCRCGGGERVGEAREQDVEAALEFGGAVVGGQGGGEAAQQGEFADRQPVQAQPQQVVGLIWVLDKFLQLVEDVAVQESEQGPLSGEPFEFCRLGRRISMPGRACRGGVDSCKQQLLTPATTAARRRIGRWKKGQQRERPG